jgi:hypothetical protein
MRQALLHAAEDGKVAVVVQQRHAVFDGGGDDQATMTRRTARTS